MITFNEYFEIKENSRTGWANPTKDVPNFGKYSVKTDQIVNYIVSNMKSNPGYDPVQGVYNVAMNANMHGEPDYHSGNEQPLNWKMFNLLKSWGFSNQEQFMFWWRQGGNKFVTQIRDQFANQ